MAKKEKKKRTYEDLNAQQKKTTQQIYRLWLRRYTEDQIVETLAANGRRIAGSTVRRYLKLMREHSRSKYEEKTLDELLAEETERFQEIIAALWTDRAEANPGSPARVGAMNAIINAETRLAEMHGLAINRLKVDADVRNKVTGYIELDVGEETVQELDGLIEKIIIAGQAGVGEGAG
jgi:hypothetical protein